MSDAVEEMVVEADQAGGRGVRGCADTQGIRRKRHRQRRKRKLGRPPFTTLRGNRGITSASVRAQEVRHEMFTHGQPVAPYNTTQFLIEDHGDLQNIDEELSKKPDSHRHSRTRDSSFSIDSDDDFFYSSPEDEEEFLTKEFSLEYQDLHVERLNSLSKADIIHDYLMLENKYEKSIGELRKMKADSGRDTDASSKSEADISEQLRLAQLENRRLKAELEKIKRENAALQITRHDSETTEDTESDSSTTSSSLADVSSPPSSPIPPATPASSSVVAEPGTPCTIPGEADFEGEAGDFSVPGTPSTLADEVSAAPMAEDDVEEADLGITPKN